MFEFAEVGGAVRDRFLRIPSNDVDFTVFLCEPDYGTSSADSVFNLLKTYLREQRFELCVITPEFYTIRAKVPETHELRARTKIADFVLARRDGPYSDGRRPDYVMPGTLLDDLSRRDFTMNAIAIHKNQIIDPFDGKNDIEQKRLRFVGEPIERIMEDGLRVMRFFRFIITLGFSPDNESLDACFTLTAAEMLQKVATDRIYIELNKMFSKNTPESIKLFSTFPDYLTSAIFRDGLHLISSLKKRK